MQFLLCLLHQCEERLNTVEAIFHVFNDKIFKFFYVYNKIKLENIQRKYDENILYFMMYYDDLEIVNAIGSSTKKHKLGI